MTAEVKTVGITAAEKMKMQERPEDLAGRGSGDRHSREAKSSIHQATKDDSFRQENAEAIQAPGITMKTVTEDSGTVADAGASEVREATEIQTEEATEIQTEEATEIQTEEATEIQTEEATEIPTGEATETRKAEATLRTGEALRAEATEIQTEEATETRKAEATPSAKVSGHILTEEIQETVATAEDSWQTAKEDHTETAPAQVRDAHRAEEDRLRGLTADSLLKIRLPAA